ncbi:hypothetical protein [Moraxella lacunata]|uniref:hypothetical protein n=1 Tax=Moraxella lacunata TaxID=477 RepID=UPI003EE13655
MPKFAIICQIISVISSLRQHHAHSFFGYLWHIYGVACPVGTFAWAYCYRFGQCHLSAHEYTVTASRC